MESRCFRSSALFFTYSSMISWRNHATSNRSRSNAADLSERSSCSPNWPSLKHHRLVFVNEVSSIKVTIQGSPSWEISWNALCYCLSLSEILPLQSPALSFLLRCSQQGHYHCAEACPFVTISMRGVGLKGHAGVVLVWLSYACQLSVKCITFASF